MCVPVDDRNNVGTNSRRRQVDDRLPRRAADLAVACVCTSTGGIEHQLDLWPAWHCQQTVEPVVRRGDAHASGALQSIARRIDTDEGCHLEDVRHPHNLYHQIGANIARPDDSHLDSRRLPIAHQLKLP